MNVKALQAKDVAEKVLFGELFILDVRNEADYENWKIEGKQVSSINRPYFDLLDGVDHIVSELPKDKDVLVVCAKEGSSIFVAEQLTEAGLENIYYLAGGMKAWSEYVKPIKVGDLKMVEVCISLTALEKAVYLIWSFQMVKQQLLMQ